MDGGVKSFLLIHAAGTLTFLFSYVSGHLREMPGS